MSIHAAFPGLLRESPAVVFVNSAAGGGRALVYLSRIQKLFESFHVQRNSSRPTARRSSKPRRNKPFCEGGVCFLRWVGTEHFKPWQTPRLGRMFSLVCCLQGEAMILPQHSVCRGGLLEAAEAILCGKPRFVDLVKVRTAEGRTRLYVGGGGIGLDAEAARFASGAYRRFPGRMRYIASALRALACFTPLEIHVEFPGSNLFRKIQDVLLGSRVEYPDLRRRSETGPWSSRGRWIAPRRANRRHRHTRNI